MLNFWFPGISALEIKETRKRAIIEGPLTLWRIEPTWILTRYWPKDNREVDIIYRNCEEIVLEVLSHSLIWMSLCWNRQKFFGLPKPFTQWQAKYLINATQEAAGT